MLISFVPKVPRDASLERRDPRASYLDEVPENSEDIFFLVCNSKLRTDYPNHYRAVAEGEGVGGREGVTLPSAEGRNFVGGSGVSPPRTFSKSDGLKRYYPH